ncbi:uncharacterized protein FOMMEDRAFT_169482 [Fomitiporia mediterranea MF3/22]|uniref:uncharacterized protein n=1 Tax=Fomitiporia mediterranea (strain MF3/22) TaxID=694068 RepID=UPI0004407FFF|nr:uncharacterized protein FOMMEDRAFT_169482 [Fomitiporia mediterranea MF3/22]EJD01343.1 hypothetical protein FOMMEDRAFT_169482 [Fomitiporia mediterranea MF3/22]
MPLPAPPPPVRVIIRLPYNRPHEGYENPPQIEWTPKKESILWEVIAKSRASDSGGTDWQGLALHLEVPLPYLLFRAQTRYEEDLKGIQHLQGPFAPAAGPPSAKAVDEDGKGQDQVGLARKTSSRATCSTKLPASGRLNTPLGIRARLNSLGYDSGSRHSKASSSSVLTLQGPKPPPIRTSTSSLPYPDSNSESEEEAEKAEEEERRLEEQEALDKKLKHLQSIMTSNTLGLVKEAQPKKKGKEVQRGRDVRSPTSPSPLRQTFAGSFRRDLSSSDLNSNTSSPQGSIPSIPSPPPENEPRSPVARHFQHTKSSSPPAISRVQAHVPYRPMTVGLTHTSDRSSTHGSSASSFTDISDMSLSSAEALENALQSNFPGTGSRM